MFVTGTAPDAGIGACPFSLGVGVGVGVGVGMGETTGETVGLGVADCVPFPLPPQPAANNKHANQKTSRVRITVYRDPIYGCRFVTKKRVTRCWYSRFATL